jgi:hypothetical protein
MGLVVLSQCQDRACMILEVARLPYIENPGFA